MDARYTENDLPLLVPPKFSVGDGVDLIPPNQLPARGAGEGRRYCVLGGGEAGGHARPLPERSSPPRALPPVGKTGQDAVLFLRQTLGASRPSRRLPSRPRPLPSRPSAPPPLASGPPARPAPRPHPLPSPPPGVPLDRIAWVVPHLPWITARDPPSPLRQNTCIEFIASALEARAAARLDRPSPPPSPPRALPFPSSAGARGCRLPPLRPLLVRLPAVRLCEARGGGQGALPPLPPPTPPSLPEAARARHEARLQSRRLSTRPSPSPLSPPGVPPPPRRDAHKVHGRHTQPAGGGAAARKHAPPSPPPTPSPPPRPSTLRRPAPRPRTAPHPQARRASSTAAAASPPSPPPATLPPASRSLHGAFPEAPRHLPAGDLVFADGAQTPIRRHARPIHVHDASPRRLLG